MKVVTIQSRELPEIAASVKQCVNQGRWVLFKSVMTVGIAQAEYYLKAGSAVFVLGKDGRVIAECPQAARVPQIDELYYFDDLPRPDSLSNASAPVFAIS